MNYIYKRQEEQRQRRWTVKYVHIVALNTNNNNIARTKNRTAGKKNKNKNGLPEMVRQQRHKKKNINKI